MSPPRPLSRAEARRIAEQQAALLLRAFGQIKPPVPLTIVTSLDGIAVYPLAQLPVQGLLSASQPDTTGGTILIDASLPRTEQRVALLHELKHIIDGGHAIRPRQAGSQSTGDGACTTFALSVLLPAAWLRADWQAGLRDLRQLASRYEVPATAVLEQLHALGLRKYRPPPRHLRPRCQWQQHEKTT